LGFQSDEILGQEIAKLFDIEVRSEYLNWLQQAQEGVTTNCPIEQVLHADGTVVPVEMTCSFNPEDDQYATTCIVRDCTERRRAEEALRESEERYRAIVDNIEDGYFELDLAGNLTFFNDSVCRMLGYSRDELLGMNYKQYMDEETASRAYKTFNRVFRTGVSAWGSEWEFTRKDGSKGYGELSISPILNQRGRTVGFRGIARDVSSRRRVEDALRESADKYMTLTQNLNVGVYRNTIGPEGRFIEVNLALVKMFGYNSKVEFLTVPVANHYQDPEEREKFSQRMLRYGFTRNEQLQLRKKDGTLFTGEVSAVVMRENGEPKFFDGVIEDITKRKQAEEEREKLIKELDAFAHTVAHDLKGPLAHIVGRAELLRQEYQDFTDDDVQEQLKIIAGRGRKMASITDHLLLLAGVRDMEVEMVPLDMSTIVTEALQRVTYRLPGGEVEITLPDEWPSAMGYGPWVEEIWVNYISNAIKYGGEPPVVELGATRLPEGTISFWVRDNGAGIPFEDQDRLFTPFTRLERSRGPGHGLGLSIVLRITDRLGGSVGVESKVGEGSTFSFFLPAADQDSG
jgi:PAS domain S-box-containing protein